MRAELSIRFFSTLIGLAFPWSHWYAPVPDVSYRYSISEKKSSKVIISNYPLLSGLQIRDGYPMMRRIANPQNKIEVKYYIILFYDK